MKRRGGPSKRLKRRFKKYDDRKNALLLASAAVILLWPAVALKVLEVLELSKYGSLIMGAWLAGVAGWFVLAGATVRRLADRYDLRCRACGRPLDRTFFPRRLGVGHPDWRADGEAPSRCPYCHVPIKEALRGPD